jgi:hypothetical protein
VVVLVGRLYGARLAAPHHGVRHGCCCCRCCCWAAWHTTAAGLASHGCIAHVCALLSRNRSCPHQKGCTAGREWAWTGPGCAHHLLCACCMVELDRVPCQASAAAAGCCSCSAICQTSRRQRLEVLCHPRKLAFLWTTRPWILDHQCRWAVRCSSCDGRAAKTVFGFRYTGPSLCCVRKKQHCVAVAIGSGKQEGSYQNQLTSYVMHPMCTARRSLPAIGTIFATMV